MGGVDIALYGDTLIRDGCQLMVMDMNAGQFRYSFTYTDDGIRTVKTNGSTIHHYTLNGSQIVTETWTTKSSSGAETPNHFLVYLYDENGAPIGMQYRTASMPEGQFYTFWFEKNLQGDVIAVYTEDGTKIGSYTYDAWGVCTASTETGTTTLQKQIVRTYNPFRYRGYYYDTDTSLYYLQSRYYNPQWGRFLNADGQLNPGIIGYNMFAYCNNNPVLGRDDNGKGWLGAIIGGAVGAAVGAGFGALTAFIKGENIAAGAIAGAVNGGLCGAIVGCIAEDIATYSISSVGTATLVMAAADVFLIGAETDVALQLINGATDIDYSSALESGVENVVSAVVSVSLPFVSGTVCLIASNYVVDTTFAAIQTGIRAIYDSMHSKKDTTPSPNQVVEVYN